jgi:hypothetical protein
LKKEEKLSPVNVPSPDRWSPTLGFRRSTSNQDISVFDFDDDIIVEPMPAPSRRMSFERKSVADVEATQVPCKRSSLEKKTMVDLEPIQAPCKRPSLDKKTITDVEPTEAPCKRSPLEKKTMVDVEPTEAPSKRPSLEKKTMVDVEPTRAPCKRPSLEEKMDTDIELKSSISTCVPLISLRRVYIPSPFVEDHVCFYDEKFFFHISNF